MLMGVGSGRGSASSQGHGLMVVPTLAHDTSRTVSCRRRGVLTRVDGMDVSYVRRRGCTYPYRLRVGVGVGACPRVRGVCGFTERRIPIPILSASVSAYGTCRVGLLRRGSLVSPARFVVWGCGRVELEVSPALALASVSRLRRAPLYPQLPPSPLLPLLSPSPLLLLLSPPLILYKNSNSN